MADEPGEERGDSIDLKICTRFSGHAIHFRPGQQDDTDHIICSLTAVARPAAALSGAPHP
jgi:hypothetical protein